MMVFEAVPDKKEPLPSDFHDMFLLSDQLLTYQTWVWIGFIQLCFIMLSYMIWSLEANDFTRGFYYVNWYYLVEYLLHYSSTWFEIDGYGFSSHILTTIYMGILLMRDE